MAESVDINLVNNEPNVDSWSLGCDIIIEEADTDIQEIRLRDIGLIGDIYTGEVPVEINPDLVNVMDLDVNVTIDGVNPNIVESQVVTYDKILKITDYSPETTNETRYAASARSVKALHAEVEGLERRVNIIEGTNVEGGLNEEMLQEYLDANKYIKEDFLEANNYINEDYLKEKKYITEEVLGKKVEEKIGEMFYWDDDEHTIIGTDHHLYSKGEISANGLNYGSGGSVEPGGGASLLKDLLDVNIQNPNKDDVLLYNGTHWQNSKLNITEQLSSYLKIDDAKITYATIEELNALKERVDSIKEDEFFFKHDDNTIGTKYNLFSEGEMSANGLNLGGGTSGGGGSTTLDGLIDVNLSSPQNGNILVFNGTHWVNKPQSELVPEVDLSDYYTKQQTQNAITTALSPYIKATDADGKYAALASFNALQSSFDRLYSALNDDTSGVINTWNEVVDFVNEYSGSEDLSTILGKMNTDINARVKVSDFDTWKTDVFNPLSVTVTNLGKKVDTNTANINKLLGWFNVDADGNLFTTLNFYSTKEISANGISQGTGGGGSGLISSVLGVGSLGATLTNDNSVVFNAYATNEIYKATQGHASRIGVLESQVGQLTTQRTKVSVSDLLTTGTRIATITIDGVAHEVKGDFLPTSGGTIIGDFGVFSIKRKDSYGQAIKFENRANVLGYIGFNNSNKGIIYEGEATGASCFILHSGNIGEYNAGSADKLTAGAIADANTGQYTDKALRWFSGIAKEAANFPSFSAYQNGLLALPLHISGTTAQIYITAGNGFYFRGNTNADWKTIAFTDSNVASATKLQNARTIWGQSFDGTGNVSGTLSLGNDAICGGASSVNMLYYDKSNTLYLGYGMCGVGGSVICGNAIAMRYGSSRVMGFLLNSSGNVTIGASDLAGTSAKLLVDGDVTLRLDVYGGSGNVVYRSLSFLGAVDKRGGLIRCGINDTYSHFQSLEFGSYDNPTMMLINSSGNVTIGASDLAGTNAKLYVGGRAVATDGFYVADSSDSYEAVKLSPTYGLYIGYATSEKYNTLLWGQNINLVTGTNGQTRLYVANGGNIGIGTTTPAYKLDVNGAINITDNYKIGGYDVLRVRTDHLAVGEETTAYQNLATHIYGTKVVLRYGTNKDIGFVINSSGNMTVGGSDKAETTSKLYVDGGDNRNVLLLNSNADGGPIIKVMLNGVAKSWWGYNPNIGGAYFFGPSDSGVFVSDGGNVLIGTATADESGAKLQVDGGCITIKNGTAKTYSYIRSGNYSVNTARLILGTCYGYGVEVDALAIYHGNVGIGINTPQYRLDVAGTLHSSGAVTFDSTLTIAGATTHNGIAYFGGTTYYINTSGNAHFNAISGSSLQVDSAAFNDTIHSNEYSGSVAKWSITKDGAASFASLSNGGLLETSTLRVSSTSTFTGKTNHNGGIGATSLNVSGTSTLSGHVGIGTSPHSTYALYVDGSICCGPIDGGTASFGTLYSSTHVPNSNNAYDLGSTSYRWASIYGVGADLSGNLTVNGTLYANGTLYTNDIDGSNIYITASGNLYLTTASGYFGAQNQRWAIDGYGNYKGQSLYINPRDNDNEIITDNNKKKTHGFPREGVAVFVNGDIAATGEISANALNQGSDIRFKHQLGDIILDLDTIANAPMFRFTWTNKENSRVQIGTSAQYWKDSARELVSVDKDDFHRLDYATLGVLIGVTLGKTVKNHEDRIKELETKVESLEAENRRLRYGN